MDHATPSMRMDGKGEAGKVQTGEDHMLVEPHSSLMTSSTALAASRLLCASPMPSPISLAA